MTKFQKILSGVLTLQVLLIALVFFLQRPVLSNTTLLVEAYDPEKIIKVSITDQNNTQLTFQKQAEQWVLPDHGSYPITETALVEILDAVSTINTNRLVATSPTSHNRLQVEEESFQRKLELEESNGKRFTFFLGSSPAANSVHIRQDGDNTVYLTNVLSAVQLNPMVSSWINTNYLQLPQDQIQSIQIQTEAENYDFFIDATGNWTSEQIPNDQTFDAAKWNNLLSGLATIRMQEPVSKEVLADYGFDSPSAIVDYVYTDAEGNNVETQLIIGKPTPDNTGYYAKVDSAAYVVKLNKAAAEKITLINPASYSSPPVEETLQP